MSCTDQRPWLLFRDRFRVIQGSLLLLLATVILTGCSGGGGTAPEPRPAQQIDVMRASRISSLQELTARSAAVIVGTAAHSRVEEVRGLPITVTNVRRLRTITGKYDASVATISQLGSAEARSPQTAAPMTIGRTYLLFVSRETSDGVDRLVLTGADGLYELTGDVFQYVGGSDSRLPQTLPAGPVDKTIAALTK